MLAHLLRHREKVLAHAEHELDEQGKLEGPALIALYKKHRSLAALIGEYKTAAKSNPDSFATQVILGHLHRRAGDNEQATKHYEKAGALNPKSPAVPSALGALYQKLGRPAEAREAYQKALALSSSV